MFARRDPTPAPRVPEGTRLLGNARSALCLAKPLGRNFIPKWAGRVLHRREQVSGSEPRTFREYAINCGTDNDADRSDGFSSHLVRVLWPPDCAVRPTLSLV